MSLMARYSVVDNVDADDDDDDDDDDADGPCLRFSTPVVTAI